MHLHPSTKASVAEITKAVGEQHQKIVSILRHFITQMIIRASEKRYLKIRHYIVFMSWDTICK